MRVIAVTRRGVLRLLGTTPLAGLLRQLAAPSNVRVVTTPTPASCVMGIGGVTHESCVYRARAPREALVQVEVGKRADLADGRLSAGVMARADTDFTAGETVTGLEPRTTYYYAVRINGERVLRPYPSFRTFPRPTDDVPVKIVWGSCQTTPLGGAFAAIGREAPDLFVHLGDFGYPNTSDLAPQRQNYLEQYDFQGDFAAYVVGKMPRAHIWDDGDYAGNQADGRADKVNSLKAFSEYVPTYPLRNATAGRWQQIRLGPVEIFLLDTRSQRESSRPRWPDEVGTILAENGTRDRVLVLRKSSVPTRGAWAAAGWYVEDLTSGQIARVVSCDYDALRFTLDVPLPITPGQPCYFRRASFLDMDMIPNGQLQWLLDGMRASTARWKVIASSVIWNPTNTGNDSWGGWPPGDRIEQRYIIQQLGLATRRDVIVLTADRHVCAIDDGTNSVIPEGTAGPFNATSYSVRGQWTHGIYDRGPGFGVLEFTGDRAIMTMKGQSGAAVATVRQLELRTTS